MSLIDDLPEPAIHWLAKLVIALCLLLAISLVAAFSGCTSTPPSFCPELRAHDPVRADFVCGGERE